MLSIIVLTVTYVSCCNFICYAERQSVVILSVSMLRVFKLCVVMFSCTFLITKIMSVHVGVNVIKHFFI
jgi:hypothetical protein